MSPRQIGIAAMTAAIGLAYPCAADPPGNEIVDLGVLGGGTDPNVAANATGLDEPGHVAGAALAGEGGPRYTITDLGPITLPGSTRGEAINNHGEVVGDSAPANGDFVATIWLPEAAYGLPAGPTPLGHLGQPGGSAYGVNDVGQVVGIVPPPIEGAAGWATAFLWDPVGGMTDLGSFGGTHSIARAINNSGWAVGESDPAGSTTFRAAILWSDEGTMIDLGAFEQGAFESRAEDINEAGQVTGHSMYLDNVQQPDSSRLRAFLWLPEPAYGLPAGMNDIDTLSVDDIQITTGKGINDRGQVVVWGRDPLNHAQYYVAFWLWLPEPDYGLPAGMNDLGGPFGLASTAFGQDINNRGEAVFRASVDPDNPFGDWRAMLWRQGEWFDLKQQLEPPQIGWIFGSATDINDRGEICGWGWHFGEARGFKLTPVTDEPAPCPSDISGNGSVDTVDLLALLAAWGDPGGPADVNQDGAVDVLDLLDLLAAWGSCEPIGACCFAFTGDCEPLTEVDCAFMGGSWTAGVSCDTFACTPPPTGACCFWPSGDCTDMNAFLCDVAGGAWQGAGTDCGSFTCPPAATGDWIGDPLVVPGLPYSTTGNSSTFNDLYDAQCDFFAEAPDVVYAYTPVADEVVNISLCANSAYDTKLYVFENVEDNTVACNDDTCTTPSYQLGEYVSRIESLELFAGNTYYIIVDGWGLESGFYTLDVVSVMPAACCLPSGECIDLSIDLCTEGGGDWFDGETCDTFVCPPLPMGACCLPGGSCVANQSEYDCINLFGGVWQGDGVSCFAANCP